MKIPEHDETEELINLANDLEVMRLVYNLPRKIIKLLCYSLKREYEMRVARDKRISRLILEVDRQRGLYRASVAEKNATTETIMKAENERLREALRFYADTSKYPAPLTGGMGHLWSDCGEVAKKALKGESNV